LNFAAGDTIVVDGTTINVVAGAAGSAASPDVALGDSVGTLLGRIGAITGATPTITGGAITLHTGTTANLTITSTGTSFPQLGFVSAVNLARTPPLTAGEGTVIANDQKTFSERVNQWRGHRLRSTVPPSTAVRW
jgi:flagellar hook protein FlgE